jgi:DNA-binding XRE family transcriptional regulator
MQNALEEYRLRHGLSYAGLARRVDLHRSTVMHHCKGSLPISESAAWRYHTRLQIPIMELLPLVPSGQASTGYQTVGVPETYVSKPGGRDNDHAQG